MYGRSTAAAEVEDMLKKIERKPLVENAWQNCGTASIDFRGDVRTTPTAAMLAAISQCSLLDDVYQNDLSTNSLEKHIASLTGKESALFIVSGTMGNQLGFRSLLTQPPYSILCDRRAHALNYEAGGMALMTGALVVSVHASNGLYLTLEDILPHVRLGDGSDPHVCPTKIISLENTLEGIIMPLDETRRISEFARRNGIHMHLDGARLWEVVAAGAGTLIAYCSLFDTVTMCFSKGLGAAVGAILVGSAEHIKRARWVRKSIGGGWRQPGMLAAMARVAVDETFTGGLLKRTHEVAKGIAEFWQGHGGHLRYPTQTNMVWLDVTRQSFTLDEFAVEGAKRGIALSGDRLIIHYQITEEAIIILKKLMADMLSR